MRAHLATCLVVVSSLAMPASARAANVLFVSDSGADMGIVTTLMMDGHTVTTRSPDFSGGMNPSLRVDLSDYDAVFWSASGGGFGDNHTDAAAFANLMMYVRDGGRVFVTGYDSIASPTDPMLIAFVGGTGAIDVPGPPSALPTTPETSLTYGVVAIGGMTPSGGSGDRDQLTGIMADTRDLSAGQWTLRTLGAGEIAYVSNGDGGSSSTPSWTTPGNLYMASVRNFAFAAEGASRPMGAPVIEFMSPTTAREGDEIVVTVMVSDEERDPVTWSWDLDDDGTFGEMPGATTYTIPAGTTDGTMALRLAVQASDGTHVHERRRTIQIDNVEPRITSAPPTMTSVGANVRYTLVVEDPGGALDPLEYAVTRGPMGVAITPAGVFVWTPTELEVTLPGETHLIEITVSDGDDGVATQMWEMSVSPNRTPDGLTLLYPANGIVIADPMPRLVVGNGTDPDVEDTLVYHFQLAREEAFETILADSGATPQAVGYTPYQLTEALTPGTYYWRAWMSDGAVETEPLTTSFVVVPDPNRDAGVARTDGAIVERDAGVIRPPDMARASCGCRAVGAEPRGRAGIGLAGLVLVALALRRRR